MITRRSGFRALGAWPGSRGLIFRDQAERPSAVLIRRRQVVRQ